VVEPIAELQQAQVEERTEHFICQAEGLFSRQFERIPVLFDLAGRTAGMFKMVGRQRCIRYNPWIFAKYFDENLSDTVPHEVAHYLTDVLYGLRNIRPHGREWQAVMCTLGAAPTVTCQYDLTGVPLRRQRRFSYRCACSSHAVSAVRHNRVQRGLGRYVCRQCRTPLVFAG